VPILNPIVGAAKGTFLLRFHGHGRSGSVNISAGQGGPDELNRLNMDSIPVLHTVIPRLKSTFGPYASIELMGCETGRGVEGHEMLRMLASLLGVPVTAGIHTQWGGGTATFRFEGPTFTAVPGGRPMKEWWSSLPALPN
jgi:hypothetical protein